MAQGNAAQLFCPPLRRLQNGFVVNTMTPECLAGDLRPTGSSAFFGSMAWTANLCIYLPLILSQPLIVSQFYWYNIATVNGSTDVGIYTEDGATKLVSTGSTLNSGANSIQVVNVSDVTLPSNCRLWLALGSDSGTHTYWGYTGAIAQNMEFIGIQQQASGFSSGLPASATFAAPSVAKIPMYGFSSKSVI